MKHLIPVVVCAGLLVVAPPAVRAQDSCDRACLQTILDQYLGAVVAHDPAAAPLAVGIRQTENAINVAPGYGTWQSVTALGEVQRRYFDPVSGQAAYYGSVQEGAESALVTARIKGENNQITEAEWYIARPNDPGLSGPRQPGQAPANLFNVDYLKQNGPPERVVPEAEHSDRDTLIRTVYTAMFYPGPELAVPNWPPFTGYWPLPASIVPTP